jgi:hypothetical protein
LGFLEEPFSIIIIFLIVDSPVGPEIYAVVDGREASEEAKGEKSDKNAFSEPRRC